MKPSFWDQQGVAVYSRNSRFQLSQLPQLRYAVFQKVILFEMQSYKKLTNFDLVFFSNIRPREQKLNVFLESAFSQLSNDIGHVITPNCANFMTV